MASPLSSTNENLGRQEKATEKWRRDEEPTSISSYTWSCCHCYMCWQNSWISSISVLGGIAIQFPNIILFVLSPCQSPFLSSITISPLHHADICKSILPPNCMSIIPRITACTQNASFRITYYNLSSSKIASVPTSN